MRDTSIGKDLIDHPSLVVLFPHMQSYCTKGLTKHIGGKNRFTPSSIETYASGVFTRVDELDSALVSLRLACKFVTELGSEPAPSTAVYRYHYENFVLRVIGLVDRAHRLVGASLLLPSEKYEAIGGNTFVQKATKTKHPKLYSALGGVAKAVNSYRGPRNELIHSSAYSSPELGLFNSIEQFSVDTGSVDLNELKRDYSSAGAAEIEETIERLVTTLSTLLEELGPVFSVAHEFSISERIDRDGTRS